MERRSAELSQSDRLERPGADGRHRAVDGSVGSLRRHVHEGSDRAPTRRNGDRIVLGARRRPRRRTRHPGQLCRAAFVARTHRTPTRQQTVQGRGRPARSCRHPTATGSAAPAAQRNAERCSGAAKSPNSRLPARRNAARRKTSNGQSPTVRCTCCSRDRSARDTREPTPPEGRWVAFKPILENFTDALTPLTVDIVRRVLPRFGQFIDGRYYLNFDSLRRWVRSCHRHRTRRTRAAEERTQRLPA